MSDPPLTIHYTKIHRWIAWVFKSLAWLKSQRISLMSFLFLYFRTSITRRNIFDGVNSLSRYRSGWRISHFYCSLSPFWEMLELATIALCISGLKIGTVFANWVTRVVKNLVVPLGSARPWEKKKLSLSWFCWAQLQVTVWEIVDSPVLAIPFNQNMEVLVRSLFHTMICCKRWTQASLK
jgi:hypothetical protein